MTSMEEGLERFAAQAAKAGRVKVVDVHQEGTEVFIVGSDEDDNAVVTACFEADTGEVLSAEERESITIMFAAAAGLASGLAAGTA